jgi:hypothetical protein
MNEKHRFDSLITCRIVAVGEIDPDITFCGFETGLRSSEIGGDPCPAVAALNGMKPHSPGTMALRQMSG